jgi:hypothetical protein
MGQTVTIGCRLPSGLIAEVTNVRVTLHGQRQAQERSPIILLSEDDYGLTEVDADFWEAFKKRVGPDYAPIKSGAVFEAKNQNEAKGKAKELKKEKTGHEPLPQEANGIKSADKDE